MLRPRISANLAISADGKISTSSHLPAGWTSPHDKQRLARLRHGADALLVGRGTFDNDRMTLTAPDDPLRCIVSHRGNIDPSHPVFSKPGGPIHLLVTGDDVPAIPAGVTVHHTDLPGFLNTLTRDYGVRKLHCEGGGELIRTLATLDVIDEIHLTFAGHILFGGAGSPTMTGVPGGFLPATRNYRLTAFEPRPDLGECFLSYEREPSGAA